VVTAAVRHARGTGFDSQIIQARGGFHLSEAGEMSSREPSVTAVEDCDYIPQVEHCKATRP